MRISDWSSDVCSSDLTVADVYLFEGVAWAVDHRGQSPQVAGIGKLVDIDHGIGGISCGVRGVCCGIRDALQDVARQRRADKTGAAGDEDFHASEPVSTRLAGAMPVRSEEHTSELQSLMRISYAVICL